MKVFGQPQGPAEDHSALASVVLIMLETLITALLRADRVSRQIARPFIQDHAVLQIHTRFPNMVFYVSFTEKGVLFDWLRPPRATITGTVSASLMDLTRGFLTAPSHVLDQIQIEGSLETVQRIEALMHTFNLQRILKSGWQFFWKNDSKDDTETPSRRNRSTRSSTLVRQIEQQNKMLEQLNLQLLEQRNDFRQLQTRHARMMALAIGLAVMLVITLAWLGWHFLR